MARRTVGSFTLDRLPVRRDQLARHHPQTPKALREDIGLDVAVVVLARPHEPARALDRLRHHIVDQTVLVVDPRGVELGLVRAFVDVLEDVLEPAVVLLHDRVLGRHELLDCETRFR